MPKTPQQRAEEKLRKRAALNLPPEIKQLRFHRRPRPLAGQIPEVDVAALDLSPFKARGDAAGLSPTASRFLALYMADRLAGNTTARSVLYRRLTGCSESSCLAGSYHVWRAIVSKGIIHEILTAAGVTEDAALTALRESLEGKSITRRRDEAGFVDYETTENPIAKHAAAKTVLELLGVYTQRLDVTLTQKTFADIVREASLADSQEADFREL
ncbi:MAG: hypothetical protein IPK72_21215 [Candidatus Eisenbacteria bacterium]|nr:hypothetical protein [Candidatus Eisenbacteria bacterium]